MERQYVVIDLHKNRSLIARDNAAGGTPALVGPPASPTTPSDLGRVWGRRPGLKYRAVRAYLTLPSRSLSGCLRLFRGSGPPALPGA